MSTHRSSRTGDGRSGRSASHGAEGRQGHVTGDHGETTFMGEGVIFAIRDGTGPDLQWTWHGWAFREGRPTRLGPLLWRTMRLKGLEKVVAEGPATPGRARSLTHENPDPRENPWLYILNPHLMRLVLFVTTPAPALPDRQAHHLHLPKEGDDPVRVGTAWYYSSREGFTYELLGSWHLRGGGSPDWQIVEEQGQAKRTPIGGAAALPAE